MAPDCWSSDVEPGLADLEERRDLHLLCDGVVVDALEHVPSQHVLELGLVRLLEVQSILPHQEPPAPILNLGLSQQVHSPNF